MGRSQTPYFLPLIIYHEFYISRKEIIDTANSASIYITVQEIIFDEQLYFSFQ